MPASAKTRNDPNFRIRQEEEDGNVKKSTWLRTEEIFKE